MAVDQKTITQRSRYRSYSAIETLNDAQVKAILRQRLTISVNGL